MRGDTDRQRDDERVPEDDAVIGRFFRKSLAAVVVIGGGVALALLLWGRSPEPEPVDEAEPTQPQLQDLSAQPPDVRFTDITREARIDFVHENGARGEKLMPETMGSGAAFFDYDGDGDPDLLLVNSTHWPGDPPGGETRATLALYSNDGSGRFEDVTSRAGLDVSLYGVGVAVGDYDADADLDLFITAVGSNRLFRNDAGRFADVTESAGVAGHPGGWGTSAGFFDADNDGDLDLFVCNYVEWSAEIDRAVDFRITGIGRAYGPPLNFRGAHLSLLRNRGDGRFVDVSREAGLHVESAAGTPVAKALGLAFVDLDSDGWTDVIVANDTAQNFVFRNRGDG
ncbi:MAG: VCBS repeat-containing protein, partial [Deltaproteobacteria bacterium]|nr:VCBS repeat-containing protein [Deltaproteobacteria bacterium]